MPSSVIANAKIRRQLQSSFLHAQPEQLRREVDHVPVRLTAKTMKPLIHFHAGIFVVVERADAHSIPIHSNSIILRSLPGSHSFLDHFKYIQFSHLQTE